MKNSTLSCRFLVFLGFCLIVGFSQAQTPTVSSLQATGTGIKWYNAPTGGTQYTGSEPLVHGQTYYASQTVNGVESIDRLAVTANLIAQPSAPSQGTHTPSQTQIIWNWNAVSGAQGYKWNTTNDYASATDMGTATTKTETGLTCNTAYARYVWAYNASGCVSAAVTLSQQTLFCCGSNLTISHVTTGGVAPVDKTVTYGTVTNIPGETNKCWITSNLGATNQATAVNDATEASAGWYWQFNRKQGYKHDGTTLTPAWTITSISENSDWVTDNDPCNLELGTAWRLPTYTEWYNVDYAGGWTNWNGPWNSLRLHAAGYLDDNTGSPGYRGSYGYYWSGTQGNLIYGWYIYFRSSSSSIISTGKADGISVRCLREMPFSCGSNLTISHATTGGVAPVDKTVTYGTVTNIPGETTKCWITSNLGATNQATAVDDATEASAGWYWQFNRKQGYQHDGTTLTPSWTITSISDDSDWITANDPCSIELGATWRIPTETEWNNVDNTGGWTTWTGPWNSGLKLHAAGYLYTSNGSLYVRGSGGYYWSSSQNSADFGWHLYFGSGGSNMNYLSKALGFSARCLRDN